LGGAAHVKDLIVRAASNPDEILLRANALFREEQSQDLRSVIAEKIEELGHYDVHAMDRVAAILSWGRSGSVLLASYLDGHEDVLMLPELAGQRLYPFFERYPTLSLRDKLIAYAAFEQDYPMFFEGNSGISRSQYYAAVEAILEFYRDWPSDFLKSRRTFFLFVHIAYNLALGRRLASPNPLIVHAQHMWDDTAARHLVEDFPQTKFIHTVRDPISTCDGVFHFHFRIVEKHVLLPYSALFCLANKDRPHSGMESRTRTIRFEDLHGNTAETIRGLANWLGLRHQAILLDSTFNGVPYVITRDGQAWSGRRLDQTQRHSWDFSPKDRALLYALFYENFVEWNYPCPKLFRHALVRCIVFVSLVLVPMKTEFTAAWAICKRTIVPAVRQGKISPVFKSLLGIGFCRFKIIWLLASAFFRRFAFGATLLQVDHKKRPSEWREDGLRVAPNETELR
jgi:hypothetical protein